MTLYYLQDDRQIVGNSMLWWREGGKGYTCDLKEAGVFTKENLPILRSSDIAWPKDYIDARTALHVDSQLVRSDECETLSRPPEPYVKPPREPTPKCMDCGKFVRDLSPDPKCFDCGMDWARVGRL